jgi:cell wall-associated NlpC family hydrolase
MLKNRNKNFTLKNKNARIFLIIMVSAFVIILIANAKEKHSRLEIESKASNITKADSLVEFSKSLIGKKYCYGSCTPGGGFDCSGFVYYVFSQFGITLPRSSYLMAEVGEEIKLRNCRKGDLIFFTGTNAESKKVGHVGIVISDKDQPVEFIHSSSGKKNSVIITPMSSSHYQKRFIKVMRVLSPN